MRITAGVGTCTLSSTKGGRVNLVLTSGGLSLMEPLPSIPVVFDGAEPRALRFRGHGDDSQRMAGQRVEVSLSSKHPAAEARPVRRLYLSSFQCAAYPTFERPLPHLAGNS